MLSYCLKCIKSTESKNPKVVRAKYGITMLLSKCAVCLSKKSKFIKEQEVNGFLSSLGIKALLNKIPLLGPLYFKRIQKVNTRYKTNEIVNKILLAGNKFIPEMHLRQPGFTCLWTDCGPFTKNKERRKNLKKQEIQNKFIKTN